MMSSIRQRFSALPRLKRNESMEEWKKIPGWPDHEASSVGRIRNHRIGRLLCPNKAAHCDHLQVRLGTPGKTLMVHRLVLMAFVGPCPKGMEARHLNDQPQDNRIENLAWGTHAENYQDRVRNGKGNAGERHGMAKLKDEEIIEIRTRRRNGERPVNLGKIYNVTPQCISHIWTGRIRRNVIDASAILCPAVT